MRAKKSVQHKHQLPLCTLKTCLQRSKCTKSAKKRFRRKLHVWPIDWLVKKTRRRVKKMIKLSIRSRRRSARFCSSTRSRSSPSNCSMLRKLSVRRTFLFSILEMPCERFKNNSISCYFKRRRQVMRSLRKVLSLTWHTQPLMIFRTRWISKTVSKGKSEVNCRASLLANLHKSQRLIPSIEKSTTSSSSSSTNIATKWTVIAKLSRASRKRSIFNSSLISMLLQYQIRQGLQHLDQKKTIGCKRNRLLKLSSHWCGVNRSWPQKRTQSCTKTRIGARRLRDLSMFQSKRSVSRPLLLLPWVKMKSEINSEPLHSHR